MRHNKPNTGGFHLHQVSKIVKFIASEWNGGRQWLGMGQEEMGIIFNKHKISVKQDEKTLQRSAINTCNYC